MEGRMSTSAKWTEPSGLAHSSAYDIFILVLTVFSLVIMALLILPLDEATLQVLRVYDNLICVVFLTDFVINLAQSRPKRAYFIDRRGWLDLLGSIPSFGVLRFTALFRLARLSRLARITRLLRGSNKKALIRDVLANRGQYAIFITFLSVIIVLGSASVLVLQFESRSPDANITTGGDALWWGFVTITTVGYGDEYPVTTLGRLVGIFVMFAGVGIIGALASILSSLLVPPPPGESSTADVATGPNLETELAAIRTELAALRSALVDASRSGQAVSSDSG
jgi:voltage-gated potassium channel